jgi:hypothetical protein
MIMSKILFALLAGGVLMLPSPLAATTTDGSSGILTLNPTTADTWRGVALEPVPHLEGMPWVRSGAIAAGATVEHLIGQTPEAVGPFIIQPLSFGPPLAHGATHPDGSLTP